MTTTTSSNPTTTSCSEAFFTTGGRLYPTARQALADWIGNDYFEILSEKPKPGLRHHTFEVETATGARYQLSVWRQRGE